MRRSVRDNHTVSRTEFTKLNQNVPGYRIVRGDGGGGKGVTIRQSTIRSSMTKEQYEEGHYSLGAYAMDCFGGKRWQARKALNQYAAGVAPMPPMPEIEGVTAEQVLDGLLDGCCSPIYESNILLTRILERLAVNSRVESPIRTKAEILAKLKHLGWTKGMKRPETSTFKCLGPAHQATIMALEWVLMESVEGQGQEVLE